LIFKVWVKPQDAPNGFDEAFMRNTAGYLRDCEKAKIEPSLFQMILLMYDSDIILTPPFWVPIWLLSALQHVLGVWIGGRLLGLVCSSPLSAL
jgi:hypothetical protein